jgi:predicted HTH domain antitoxin
MKITVELPEIVLERPEAADAEVYREMVLSAYGRGRLSAGRVAELLGLDRWSADQLLARRGLTTPFTVEAAGADLRVLQGLAG